MQPSARHRNASQGTAMQSSATQGIDTRPTLYGGLSESHGSKAMHGIAAQGMAAHRKAAQGTAAHGIETRPASFGVQSRFQRREK